MRQRVITSGIARWDAAGRHTVRITDEAGGLLDWSPIAQPGQRPGLQTLGHTSWHGYPGSDWQEDEHTPGSWTRPVFRHALNADSEAGP